MMPQLADLPRGGVAELARRINKPKDTVYYWIRLNRIPGNYEDKVQRVAKDILDDYERANGVTVRWGEMSKIAALLGKPPSTVRSWIFARVPPKHCRAFLMAFDTIKSECRAAAGRSFTTADLARRLNKPYTTVYHWLKYGANKQTNTMILTAIKEMEGGK